MDDFDRHGFIRESHPISILAGEIAFFQIFFYSLNLKFKYIFHLLFLVFKKARVCIRKK